MVSYYMVNSYNSIPGFTVSYLDSIFYFFIGLIISCFISSPILFVHFYFDLKKTQLNYQKYNLFLIIYFAILILIGKKLMVQWNDTMNIFSPFFFLALIFGNFSIYKSIKNKPLNIS
jgi:hypothetical protein